jgi:hypothetical protein
LTPLSLRIPDTKETKLRERENPKKSGGSREKIDGFPTHKKESLKLSVV